MNNGCFMNSLLLLVNRGCDRVRAFLRAGRDCKIQNAFNVSILAFDFAQPLDAPVDIDTFDGRHQKHVCPDGGLQAIGELLGVVIERFFPGHLAGLSSAFSLSQLSTTEVHP